MTALAVTLDGPPARRRKLPTLGLTRVRVTERVELALSASEAEPSSRPKTRAGCADVPRPCPYASCAHNLFLDVNASGGLKQNFAELEDMPAEWSCALDVVDRGGATLEEIGSALGISREAVRLIEVRAFDKLRVHLRVIQGAR